MADDVTRTQAGGRQPDPQPQGMPATIGRYRVLGKLGEGGMGVVYEAEQDNPRRLVAVKVVRAGYSVDEQHVRMFRREVETLARLDHPNIGGIYESGCTDDGRQFFAMELTRGRNLDAYLATRPKRLDAAELRFRLALFHRIAETVHYAHQRGVIHRDLKPSNIVVAETPADAPTSTASASGLTAIVLPAFKILDFGVARITDGDLAEASVATEVGVIKGTLAYMSPEQTRGRSDEIDVRTDVYALGVILYEILTGKRPYDLVHRAMAEAVRVIQEEPPRSLRQGSDAFARVDPDLETIAQKALEKEAERRYGSAAEFAGDIARYLTSQPILARPPSAAYQIRKLIERNRVPAALVAVLLVAVVGFGVGMSVLYARATSAESSASDQAEIATRALDFMTGMFEVADPSEALGQVVTVREILDRGALRIKSDLAGQPEIRSTLMTSMGRVYNSLGLNTAAEPLLTSASESSREAFGAGDARTLGSARALGQLRIDQGRFDAARVLLEKALAPFAGAEGDRLEAAASARTTLADAYRELGRTTEAERLYLLALGDLRPRLGEEHAETLSAMNNLAILYTGVGRFEEAEKLARGAYEAQKRKVGPDHPELFAAKNTLANVFAEQRRFEEAESLLREAVTSALRVAGPEHPDTLTAKSSLAMLMIHAGRYAEATAIWDEILEIQRRTLGPDHPSALLTLNNKVVTLQQQDRYDEAYALAVSVVEGYTRTLGPEHPQTLMAANNLATHDLGVGRYAAAEVGLREVLEIRERVQGKDHPDTAISLENWANSVYKLGRLDEVPPILERVLAIRTEVFGESHPTTSRTRLNLAVVYGSQGNREEARSILEKELVIQREALGKDHPSLVDVHTNLSAQLSGLGKHDEAIAAVREAIRIQRLAIGPKEIAVAPTLQRLALTAAAAKRWDVAEEAILEAIEIRTAKLGADAPETLLSRYWRAKHLGDAGKPDEALRLVESVHGDSVRTKVTRFPLVRESAKLAAEIQERLGNAAAAKSWRAKS